MSEKILKYSVLRYSPSTESGEKINIGILFSSECEKISEFKYIKRFSRLEGFDDEIDISLVRNMLKDIAGETNRNSENYEDFNIEEYTKYYINDFCFEKPKAIAYSELSDMIFRLHKLYFRFEYKKNERSTRKEDMSLISEINKMYFKKPDKKRHIVGKFNEEIKYDFLLNNCIVKLYDFDKKNLKNMYNWAKVWAWNNQNIDEKVLVVYRVFDETNIEELDIILSIFRAGGVDVCSLDKYQDYIENNIESISA